MDRPEVTLKRELLNSFAANDYSLNGLSSHRIAQMLLLECMKDKSKASDMADQLIKDMGDIKNILFSDIACLCSAGLMHEEAENLVMIGAVFSRISADSVSLSIDLSDRKAFADYLDALFRFELVEKLYVFPVVNNRIVDCCFIFEGDEKSIKFNLKHIVKLLAGYPECSSYILAHNHPNKLSEPSPSDITATKILASELKLLGYDLIGHFTVGSDGMDVVLEDMNYVEYLFSPDKDKY